MRLPKHYRKNKRVMWKKGESGKSNPSCLKFRNSVRQTPESTPATSNQSQSCVHPPGFIESGSKKSNDAFSDAVSIASIITTASNPLFGDLAMESLHSLSQNEYRQRRHAVLSAVTDAIRLRGGREHCNEYYSVLINLLENEKNKETKEVAADLLCRVITKGLTTSAIHHVFEKCSTTLMQCLSQSASGESILQRNILCIFGHFLQTMPVTVWVSEMAGKSTSKIANDLLTHILPYCFQRKSSVREAACTAVTTSLYRLRDLSSQYYLSPMTTVMQFLRRHQQNFLQLATSDSVERDMVYFCQLLGQCWPVFPPASIHACLEDVILPLMKKFSGHKVCPHFIGLLQELFAQHLSLNFLPLGMCEEAAFNLMDCRPSVASWLMQRAPSQLQKKSTTSSYHPVQDACQKWFKALVALFSHLSYLGSGSMSENTEKSGGPACVLIMKLLPVVVEVCFEWLLLDREGLVQVAISSALHEIIRQEVIAVASQLHGKFLIQLVSLVRNCLSLDYEIHWTVFVRLGEDLLHLIYEHFNSTGDNSCSVNDILLNSELEVTLSGMLAEMASMRALQSNQVSTDAAVVDKTNEKKFLRQKQLNSAVESLFGSAVELLGAHWVLDKGLDVNIMTELRERGRLRTPWLLPLLARYTKKTQLRYFSVRLLPTLVALNELLIAQRRQLWTQKGSAAVKEKKSHRMKHSGSKNKKMSLYQLSTNEGKCDDSSEEDSDDIDVDSDLEAMEAEVETMVNDSDGEDNDENRAVRLLRQSCDNIASLCRHVWASLPGFCTNPTDLSPSNAEPLRLVEALYNYHSKIRSEISEENPFVMGVVSLYRGYVYRGLAALAKSLIHNEVSITPEWRNSIKKWIPLLLEDHGDVSVKEEVLRSFLGTLEKADIQQFADSALLCLKNDSFTLEHMIMLKAIVPLLETERKEKLIRLSILAIKKTCAMKAQSTDENDDDGTSERVKERRIFQLVASICASTTEKASASTHLEEKIISLTVRLLRESLAFTFYSSISKARLLCWKALFSNPHCPKEESVWSTALSEILASLTSNNKKTRLLAGELLPQCCDWLCRVDASSIQPLINRLFCIARGDASFVQESLSKEEEEEDDMQVDDDTGDKSAPCVSLSQRLNAAEAIRMLILASDKADIVMGERDSGMMEDRGLERQWKECIVQKGTELALELTSVRSQSQVDRSLVRVGLQIGCALYSKAARAGNSHIHFPVESQLRILKGLNDDCIRALRMEVKIILKKILSKNGIDTVRLSIKNPHILKIAKNLSKEEQRKKKNVKTG